MDLALYARVAWRFRILVLVGALLGVVLATLSVGRVSLEGGPKITSRGEQWSSTATILVTQRGYPLGRAVYDEFERVDTGAPEPAVIPKYSDPSRFGTTALLYARLATSDAVRQLMRKSGPINGAILASTQTAEVSSAILLPTHQHNCKWRLCEFGDVARAACDEGADRLQYAAAGSERDQAREEGHPQVSRTARPVHRSSKAGH